MVHERAAQQAPPPAPMEVEEEEVGAGSAALAEPAAPAPSEKEQEAPTHTAAAAEEMVDPSAVRLQGAQPGQPLGLKRVLAVDLPVLCASPMTAVSMLGGLDRLSAACTGKSRKLQFYFRPDDELSIPLGSQIKQPSSRLLLRIKVRRDRTTGKKVVARTEVLGSVSTTFRFNALADFQYLTTQSFLPSGTPDVISKTRLEIVPSSYETSAFPGKYAYTTLKSSALATNETARRQNVVIRFGDAIPEAPPDVLVNRPRRRSEKYNQVLEKLQAFFDRNQGGREMWQRKALEAKFEGEGLHAFLELLRVVAYNMSNGPWRGLWVRYGFDPIRDPVARYYQALDVRWKEANLNKLKATYRDAYMRAKGLREAPPEHNEEEEEGEEGGGGGNLPVMTPVDEEQAELKLFGMPVRRQMVFQLCDLGSPGLQQVIFELPRKAACTTQGGWFTMADLNNLRLRIKRYLSGYVAECARTLCFEPSAEENLALSPADVILEAEQRKPHDQVTADKAPPSLGTTGSSGRGPAGAGGGRGGGRATARKRKAAAGRGAGGRGRGGRRAAKRSRRDAEEEEGEEESEEEEEEEYEGEDEDDNDKDNQEEEGEEQEEQEEEQAQQEEPDFDEDADGMGEAAALNVEAFLGRQQQQQGRASTTTAAAAAATTTAAEAEDTLGSDFVIPLTAGDLAAARSIRLLGGFQGAETYSSSSSDDDSD